MRPRHDSNAHDVPAPQAGALSRLSYGGKKATSPLPLAGRTTLPRPPGRARAAQRRGACQSAARESRAKLDERMQFSKDVSNYTCTSVHVETLGWPMGLPPTSARVTGERLENFGLDHHAGPGRIERPLRGLESRSSPRHGPGKKTEGTGCAPIPS